MGWELPAQLRPVHKLVEGDSPWPDPDEDDRLLRALALLDLADGLRGAAAELDAAHEEVLRANEGRDVDAYKEKWESAQGARQRLLDGASAAELAALGTVLTVVLRVVWKAMVVWMLTMLLVAFAKAVAATPAGGFWLTLRVYVTRRAFRTMLAEIRKNIGVVIAQTLRVAMKLLLGSGAVPVTLTGVAAYLAGTTSSWMKTDDDARREVERVLGETPSGRAALAWAREHGVTILYQRGTEQNESILGRYDGDYNVIEIYLRDGYTPEQLASTLVHEVNHARHRHTPDPTGMSRDAYTEAAIREEAQGNIQAYRFSEELERARGRDVADMYEGAYESAYDKAVADARTARSEAGGAPLTAAEERRIGERAAAEAMYDLLKNTSYNENYREDWDAQRSPARRIWNHIID
ncbi:MULTISPECIES: hypothetical protein [unclassified Nonomuraea]|uniref:hypothetical protein n=1 Tax=unclassified Nonomuraea TaxID=2593643 RepID=UPI003409D42E